MKKKLLPVLLLLCFNSLFARNEARVKLVFRYDDFLLIPSRLSDSLFNTFSKNKIPLCIGIVPFDTAGKFLNRLDSAAISDLRSRIRKGEVEVALHGFNHRNQIKAKRFSKATFSEFATIPFDVQRKKISAGKKNLDSLLATDIKTFVPPFNTYDDNTIDALESLGFEVLSGSRQGSSNGKTIRFIPATYEDFSGLSEVVKKNRNKDVSVIVYFHPYTFKGSSSAYESGSSGEINMKRLDSLLAWLNTQNPDFNTFTSLADKVNLNHALFQDNSMRYNLLKKSLNYMKFHNYATISSSDTHGHKLLYMTGNIFLHLLVFCTVFYLAGVFLKILHPAIFVVLSILSACFVPLSAYLVYIRNDFSFGMIVIMLAVVISALLLRILKTYRLQAVIKKPII
jgi:hypothetical protein